MNNPIYVHALRYATEATKCFLMEEYKRKFPHYFDNAVLETRPATDEDYFVPPSISDKCIVVVKTRFDEIGCKRLSCFPFKKNWEPCEKDDPLQWVRIGADYELACQKSCEEHSINTEWSPDGRCVIANPLKKVLASMPEKLFQRASRHVFHGGLDVVDGELKINKRYCDVYGLDFVDDDCVASGGQKFGEFLFGKTVIRAAKAGNVQPLNDRPPPIPSYMNYPIARKRRRAKRSVSMDDSSIDSESLHNFATELVKDLGTEFSEYAIENFLKRKAPKLLAKGIDKIATKLVLKNSVVVAMKQVGTLSLKALGSAAGVVTAAYAIYDLVVGILDVIDPFDYLKVIDKEKLEKIDDELDYKYFQDGPVRSELTPVYVWENELLADEEAVENQLAFMTLKVEEYLEALQTIPENEYQKQRTTKQNSLIHFVWDDKTDWNKTLFKYVVFVIICFTVLFLEWIHIWTCCLFFVMLFYKPY